MQRPKNRISPRIEAMESRALLTALAPREIPHDVEDRVAGIRRHPHQQSPRASVEIINKVIYDGVPLAIKVRAQLFVDSNPGRSEGPHTIGTKPRIFNFGNGPHGDSWEIKIFVARNAGSPPPNPTPPSGLFLVKKPNGGYHGKSFTITVIGDTFAVSS